MKIKSFRIQNYRNIKLAECSDPPDFMVVCGGNGCGKSALLSAIMAAKEIAGSYGNYQIDPRAVSADATHATISLTLEFSDADREAMRREVLEKFPEREEIVIILRKDGGVEVPKRSGPANRLLTSYSRGPKSHGFFDYFDAHRLAPKRSLSTWDANHLSDSIAKQTLAASGTAKFQFLKEYLASLVMRDLHEMQAALRAGTSVAPDSLKPIREFFNRFFSPLKFVDVQIDRAPFEYIIETPRGRIDLDDLSSGEKEIFNAYIRFHQLNPKGAIILFDEADAHLHPDLERRYLHELRALASENQFWITTHSPEMMIAAGSESLFTLLKEPPPGDGNQFVRVTNNDHFHSALSEIMGSRGIVSFNQRIIFIEGEESSADREVYEKFYPPAVHNVTFVPAGNSATVRKTAERVNELLSAKAGFQYFYSIVDGDIERPLAPPIGNSHLFQLPVYHIENLLLDFEAMLHVSSEMLASKNPYQSPADIEAALKRLALTERHLKPFTRAVLDARLAKVANEAWDAAYKAEGATPVQTARPTFGGIETEATELIQRAVSDGTWRARCKGRDLLNAFCALHGIKYEHFRNCLIAKIKNPPEALSAIMLKIASPRQQQSDSTAAVKT